MDAEQLLLIQQAVDARDEEAFLSLLEAYDGSQLSQVQMYAESSLLMYVCQRGTPTMVKALLDKSVEPFELPFSDNNELKAAARNSDHAAAVLEMLLAWLEPSLARSMISEDWGFEDEEEGETALDLARGHADPRCAELLQNHLN